MKIRSLIAVVLVGIAVAAVHAQSVYLAWDFWTTETAATMQSRYIYGLVVNDGPPMPLSVTCVDPSRTCTAPIPTLGSGTYKLNLRAACAVASGIPPVWGPISRDVAYTVGGPLPTFPVNEPLTSAPSCASAPQPPTTSTNGTMTPPASSLTDASGAAWTMVNSETQRNGVHICGGYASQLLWWNGKVYAVTSTPAWYRYDDVCPWTYLPAGDPRVTAPPPTGPEMSLNANPATITAGQSSTLNGSFNSATRHNVRMNGAVPSYTCAAGVCSWTQVVSPTTTTTYTVTAILTDLTPAPSVSATVTVTAPIPPVTPESCAADGTGNGIDEDKDGQVDEGCKPVIPLPPAPASSITITGCNVILTATAADRPDSTSGWRAQFRIDGVNVGTYDASAPYGPRTKAIKSGTTYTKDIVWSKLSTLVPVVVSQIGPVTCP